MNAHPAYRPEIDGLRAVAVLPVILFHAGFSLFSGGYVGVDVFFVISGYLITGILISDLERGSFSIARFYERRARRILPALFVVMLACLPFAWLWMLPGQLQDFSASLMAVVFFVSNILFYNQSGYFAASAELKPLLHTWSLAVEEQYYLLFPIALRMLWRHGRARAFAIVAAIAVASLLLAGFGGHRNPDANFYLAPSRAWELLAGSVCAFATAGPLAARRGGLPVRSKDLLAGAGLALIVHAILRFDATTPAPGFYTLAPVCGTMMILLFAAPGTWVARLLSMRGLVGVGLISYSAYLWHQPLFAFARLRSLTEPGMLKMSALAALSLALAWITWRWIEQPLRDPRKPVLRSRNAVFAVGGAVGAIFVAVGAAGYLGKGFEGRLNDQALALLATRTGDSSPCRNALSASAIAKGADCRIGAAGVAPSIAIIGDSHVSAITDALSDQLAAAGLAAVNFNDSWCLPLRNIATEHGNWVCPRKIGAALDQILARPEIGTVILHAEWAYYVEGFRWPETTPVAFVYDAGGQPDFSQGRVDLNGKYFRMALAATLDELVAGGKRVILTRPTPEHEQDVLLAAARAAILGLPVDMFRLEPAQYDRRADPVRTILIEEATARGIAVVDPKPLYCDQTQCATVDAAGRALYTDENHLSYVGSQPLAKALVERIMGGLPTAEGGGAPRP